MRIKRLFSAFLCLSLATGVIAGIPALAASGNGYVRISSTGATSVWVSEVCSSYEGNLYREDTLGDPYFDGVRSGDRITVPIDVEADGEYHLCVYFGWADATGDYTVDVDGVSVRIHNTVPGQGWRNWVNSTEATMSLRAGKHTLTLTNHTAGPNIRAVIIAPVGVALTAKMPGGTGKMYRDGMEQTAVRINGTYAVQFRTGVPFDRLDLNVASWNNDIGSFRLSLYTWNTSYSATLNGTPIYTQDYINFRDNSVLRFDVGFECDPDEFLLYVENISENPGEPVGIWAFSGVCDGFRNYLDNEPTKTCAMLEMHYTDDGDGSGVFLPVSEVDAGAEKLTRTEGCLYPDGEPAGYPLGPDGQIGTRFCATAPFTGVQAYVTSTPVGSCFATVSLYRWDKNYPTTLGTAPVATRRLTDLSPNKWAGLDGEFAAGEYLFVLSDGTDKLAFACVEKPDGASVTYLHTSACGISLCARLAGENVGLGPVSDEVPVTYVNPDGWVGVDGLGRVLPTYEQVGGVREGKYVGLFFHTWHANFAPVFDISNASEVIAAYPEAKNDYNHPAWQGKLPIFWDQPVYGYYNTLDAWVLRRQAELLADAGVDVVFFDNTNGQENYLAAITRLCEVWAEARADGVRTPRISALLNMYDYDSTAKQLIELYDCFYSKGLYRDLWFLWEGKPLMIAYPEHLKSMGRTDVLDFFTYRTVNPSYTATNDLILPHENDGGVRFSPEAGFSRYTAWKWISIYPQQTMKKYRSGEIEEMAVSVAQNWSARQGLTAMNDGDEVYGRGYTSKNGPDTSEYAVTHGLNFAEQFEYALEVDPTFIWITGWNEWEAGRVEDCWGTPNAMPDNATDGYSRDIEPTTGLIKDYFYYQMVSYIRRFKGMNPTAKTAAVRQSEQIDWDTVEPVFCAYPGNTFDRDCDGYVGYHYKNTTGRNDIVEARVTCDSEYVWFMVKTADNLSPETDPAWMRLLIDVGEVSSDGHGWESFSYIVNRTNPSDGRATLEKSTGGWNWEKVSDARYTADGNRLVIRIARADVGAIGETAISFKWNDNMQTDGDIMDFYVSGDTAPGGRFRYTVTLPAPGTPDADTQAQTDAPTDGAGTDVPDTQPDTEGTAGATDMTETETDGGSGGGCRSFAGASVLAASACAAAATCLKSVPNGRKSKRSREDGERL